MTAKSKGGRPAKVIDYPKLEALCKIQCTGDECAAVLGMDYDTLNTALTRDGNGGFSDYRKEFANSGKASLRRLQFKAAEAGNVTMLIFLGKNLLGQRDQPEQEGHSPGTVSITFTEAVKP